MLGALAIGAAGEQDMTVCRCETMQKAATMPDRGGVQRT